MFIFNQDESIVVNSDNVHCFSVFIGNIELLENTENPWILAADEYELGSFKTEKDAKRELKNIVGLIYNGSHEYKVDKDRG